MAPMTKIQMLLTPTRHTPGPSDLIYDAYMPDSVVARVRRKNGATCINRE
mgnify:FL=1